MKEETIRTTLTIYKTDKDVLDSLSELSGESISFLVREMIRSVVPSLKTTVEALIEAKTDREKALDKLSGVFTEAEEDAKRLHSECEAARKKSLK